MLRKFIFIIERFIIKSHYNHLRNKYNLPQSFKFNGKGIVFYGEGRIRIGENSYIGSNSRIQAARNATIHIGKGCMISHNVMIYTKTALADQDFSQSEKVYKTGDVVIGDFVWIGANVFINPGIQIGSNTVIGANSVVTHNIGPNMIYGGVPARLIREKDICI